MLLMALDSTMERTDSKTVLILFVSVAWVTWGKMLFAGFSAKKKR